MADFVQISQVTYYILANKAIRFTGNFESLPMMLAEAFPIWAMQPEKWDEHTFSPTGRWHFQIKQLDKKPIGYLHAIIHGPRIHDWDVVAAFNSRILAQGVDNAMGKIDSTPDETVGEARLIVNPIYQVTALWIHNFSETNNDRFVIAYSPNQNQEESPSILTMDDFFRALIEIKPIQGRNYENRG